MFPRNAHRRFRSSQVHAGGAARPLFEALEPRLLLSTFTVTTVDDGVPGSLRAAIELANANPGHDTIVFDIPGSGVRTIAPLAALPDITDPVTIDGYTQPGASANTLVNGNDAVLLIELSGENASSADGLTILGGSSTVRGLAINRFIDGIQIDGPGGNVIAGNFIGTDASGFSDQGNSDDGVDVNGVGGNLIGGTTPAARNVISGNVSDGIVISGVGVTNNRVEGNFIGTTADGLSPLGNLDNGVRLASVSGNTIGGTAAGAGNVISGNLSDGVDIRADGNSVLGNHIGVDVNGDKAVGNGVNGVFIFGSGLELSRDNLIATNIIAGNFDNGMAIEGDQASGNRIEGNFIGTNTQGLGGIGNARDGVKVFRDAHTNAIGGPGAGNVISGNGSDGVEISAGDNTVRGNIVGLTPDGAQALANLNNGVVIRGELVAATGNIIGSTSASGRNIISGNTSDGVEINGSLATGNLVIGNYIGLDPSGTQARGNNSDGVKIVDAPGNTIGGGAASARNVISGNGSDGVQIEGSAATQNAVLNNLIGLAADGVAALGNNSNGVRILGATDNRIGDVSAGNIIAANGSDGVQIAGSNNRVRGNRIGTDSAGLLARPNASNGVLIIGSAAQSANGNTIGGVLSGQGNLVSGNLSDGVEINGAQASGNLVYGNIIGLSAAGLPLPNASDGVEIEGARNSVIGGVLAGQGNTIAGNTVHGVSIITHGVTAAEPSGNSVRGNRIHGNGQLGINLGPTGVNANDPLDADSGPNALQNHPTITQAKADGGVIHVIGTLGSVANQTFTIDLYLNDQADPSGHGEGRTYIGSMIVVTNASGDAALDVMIAASASPGQFVTATATSSAMNTSEFSAWIEVMGGAFVLGDMDGNGVLDAFDVDDFELALADRAGYLATHPGIDPDVRGDANGDGRLDAFDVAAFEALLAGIGSEALRTESSAATVDLLTATDSAAWRSPAVYRGAARMRSALRGAGFMGEGTKPGHGWRGLLEWERADVGRTAREVTRLR